MRQEGKSAILKDIEIGPTAFERESFVPVCTSHIFICTSKGPKIGRLNLLAYFRNFETHYISEPFEVQKKIRGTNVRMA